MNAVFARPVAGVFGPAVGVTLASGLIDLMAGLQERCVQQLMALIRSHKADAAAPFVSSVAALAAAAVAVLNAAIKSAAFFTLAIAAARVDDGWKDRN